MRLRTPAAVGGVVVTAALLLGAAPAGAAKITQTVTVTCPAMPSFTVTVGGNGDWTPARVNGSNAVLHPVAFGEFTGTFTPTGGSPETFTDPPFARKTTPNNGKPTMTCSYHIDATAPDGTFSGDGSATLWAS
jgi:hypothetical protein